MRVVGIVGCGNIAKAHARALARHEDVDLAFCDRNIDKAQALAARWHSTKVYIDLDDMLAMEKLHALYVLTRVDSHVALVARALEAGIHVYVEKPITETRHDFDALREAADKHDCVLYPGFSSLGLPAVRRAFDVVRSGRYGRLVTAHCDYHWTTADATIPYGSAEHWAYSLRGGILQNLADHPTSIVVHLLDEVQETSSLRRRRATLPNHVHDLLHIAVAGGTQLASLTMSFGHGNARGVLSCDLEGATVVADLRTHVATVTTLQGQPSLVGRTQASLMASASTMLGVVGMAGRRLVGRLPRAPEMSAMTDNFLAVIEGVAEPIVNFEKAAKTIQVLDAVWDPTG